MSIHVDYDLCISDLPRECIEDCSASGSVDDAVAYWREQLDFSVDQEAARKCLKGYGAWDEAELADDDANTDRILWLACGTFAEYITEAEDAGFDPFGDRPDDFEPNSGSDIFTLD